MQSNPCPHCYLLGVPLLLLPLPLPPPSVWMWGNGRGYWAVGLDAGPGAVLSGRYRAALHSPGLLAHWSWLSSTGSVHPNLHLLPVSACFPFPKTAPLALNSPPASAFPSSSRNFWVSPGPHKTRGIRMGKGVCVGGHLKTLSD